jgi:hypothetical protein
MANMLYQWLLIACTGMFHPFFVSMTDVNYNNKEKSLEISVRIFTDDFENTIRKNHPETKIDILHPANAQQMNGFVKEYLQQHLQLMVNGKPVTLAYVGYEQQSESIWTYFEVDNIAAVQKISVENTILHDYSDKQINLMHLKVNSNEQSDKLDYPKSSALFVF